jgi:small-conductance mechanosensitive channel
MLKSIKITNNLVVVLLIIVAIFYIIFYCKELFKERVDALISSQGSFIIKIITFFIVGILFLIFYYVSKYIEKKLNIHFMNVCILIILCMLILINHKLNTNLNISKLTGDLNSNNS